MTDHPTMPTPQSAMNEHEERLIAAFVLKDIRERYRFLLSAGDMRRRGQCCNRLNHCRDFDERFVTWLPRDPRSTMRKFEIAKLLCSKGCRADVYVFGSADSVDGKTLPLLEAMTDIEAAGFGALLSCVPGKLAYYYDELGERRAILERE
ncbi:hypothetical protein [Novipirellula artificiosorum]|nr:hypothetical protein [Novipirellula artificiosorum]